MLDFTRTTADDLSSSIPSEPASSATPPNDQALLDAYSNAVIGVIERIGPAVVRVETGPASPQSRERGGMGSGIVISPDGLVLTNSHVVGTSKQIRLRDNEGIVTEARVLGVDPDTDLALLRPTARAIYIMPRSAIRRACAAANWWSRSATRSALNRPPPPAWCRRWAARSARPMAAP
jgi:S1-C subfamily serine protease